MFCSSNIFYIMFSKLYGIISNYALLNQIILYYISILVCIQCAYMRKGPIGTGGTPGKGKVCDTKTKDMA